MKKESCLNSTDNVLKDLNETESQQIQKVFDGIKRKHQLNQFRVGDLIYVQTKGNNLVVGRIQKIDSLFLRMTSVSIPIDSIALVSNVASDLPIVKSYIEV